MDPGPGRSTLEAAHLESVMAEPARRPEPQKREAPAPAEAVDRILEDAQKRPDAYARETIVPRGGE